MRKQATAILARILAPALIVSVTAGCTMAGNIDNAADFNSAVVGKSLVNGGSWVKLSSNGTASGNIGGKPISLGWTWDGKYFCRTDINKPKGPKNQCQTVSVTGNTVAFTQDKGAGKTTKWSIK